MKLLKIKKKFFILIVVTLTIKFISSNIYQESEKDDDFYNQYLDSINNRKISSKNNSPKYRFQNSHIYEKEYMEKPTSTLDFLYKNIKKKIYSYFYYYNEYIESFEFVLSKFHYLFRRFSSRKIINKTLSNSFRGKNSKNDDKYEREMRKLQEKTIKLKTQSYPYNNTNLYNNYTCLFSPDLKVFYYYYFCNGEKVSKSTYEKKISQGEKCEFYNNTQKICFCPIHYSSCRVRSQSRIRCMPKEVIVNNDINLTKYYDTFYDEFFKTTILDNREKKFNFSIKLKCGMPISDSITGSNINFYLSNANDENAEFDIISTMYNNSTNGTQYTKEQVMNNTNNILDYFIKKENLIMIKKPKISLTFSIIDQQWALPYRIKRIIIDNNLIEDIFSGEKSLNFTVDINDIMENELGIGPFSMKNSTYPYFNKGDLYFYEINLEDEEKQVNFYPFRGEIKK